MDRFLWLLLCVRVACCAAPYVCAVLAAIALLVTLGGAFGLLGLFAAAGVAAALAQGLRQRGTDRRDTPTNRRPDRYWNRRH